MVTIRLPMMEDARNSLRAYESCLCIAPVILCNWDDEDDEAAYLVIKKRNDKDKEVIETEGTNSALQGAVTNALKGLTIDSPS